MIHFKPKLFDEMKREEEIAMLKAKANFWEDRALRLYSDFAHIIFCAKRDGIISVADADSGDSVILHTAPEQDKKRSKK